MVTLIERERSFSVIRGLLGIVFVLWLSFNSAFSQQKLSPVLRIAVNECEIGLSRKCSDSLSFLVRVCGTSLPLELSHALKIGNELFIVRGSIIDANQWAEIPEVLYIDGQGIRSQRMDFYSNISTGVQQLHRNPSVAGATIPLKGKGVIIGIVDVGYQPNHITFLDSNGSFNRILAFWDQNKNGKIPPGFGYGHEMKLPQDFKDYRDFSQAHGTHVAGIAAGSGFGFDSGRFTGAAPAADIILVNIRYYNDTIPEGALSDYLVANPAIIDGFDYIFRKADELKKPAVCNLSWGMHTGPHDGTSMFDLALDALTGPGKIIVGAAGNSNGINMHLGPQKIASRLDTLRTFIVERRSRTLSNEELYVDFWGEKGSGFSLAFEVYDSFGNFLSRSPFFSTASGQMTKGHLLAGIDTLHYTLVADAAYVNNNRPNMLMMATNSAPANRFVAVVIVSDSTTIHAWNSGGIFRYSSGSFLWGPPQVGAMAGFTQGNNDYTIGENGGTAKRIITVGAHSAMSEYTDHWGNQHLNPYPENAIAGFSSLGPRYDGSPGPDITAPGVNVISAYNWWSISDSPKTDAGWWTIHKNDTFVYKMMNGTSMAAPQVAGIVALMLSLRSDLTPERVRDILRRSATADSITGSVPNNVFGYGRVNAVEALKLVSSISSVDPPQGRPEFFSKVYPNPVKEILTVEMFAEGEITAITLLDVHGRLIKQISVSSDSKLSFPTHDLPQGFYLLSVFGKSFTETHRLVK